MTFNVLNQNEKLSSLLYVTSYDVSSEPVIKKKQFEMLKVLWENYIKECDYSDIVRVFKDKGFTVYTFVWPEKLSLTELELLLGRFAKRTELYVAITYLLDKVLKKIRPTHTQEKFAMDFTYYLEDWYTYELDEVIKIFRNEDLVERFVNAKDDY